MIAIRFFLTSPTDSSEKNLGPLQKILGGWEGPNGTEHKRQPV